MLEQAFLDAQAAAFARHSVEVEQRFVDVPIVDGRAQVHVAGDGTPVILLNGIGTPSAMWAPLMARLDGFAQYAIDLPGFGLTSTTSTVARDLRATAISFLEQVLDGLGLARPAIIANSLGSLWSSWFAMDHPDRVDTLVHIGCPAIVLGTSAPLPMRLLSVRPLGRLMMKLQPPSDRQVEQLSKMVKEYPLPPEIAELLLATEQLPGFEQTFLAMLHALVRPWGSRPEMTLTGNQLALINTPTLLIFGRDDPMGAASVGRLVADALPDAKLYVVDGGHAPWIHNADQIATLIKGYFASRAGLSA